MIKAKAHRIPKFGTIANLFAVAQSDVFLSKCVESVVGSWGVCLLWVDGSCRGGLLSGALRYLCRRCARCHEASLAGQGSQVHSAGFLLALSSPGALGGAQARCPSIGSSCSPAGHHQCQLARRHRRSPPFTVVTTGQCSYQIPRHHHRFASAPTLQRHSNRPFILSSTSSNLHLHHIPPTNLHTLYSISKWASLNEASRLLL